SSPVQVGNFYDLPDCATYQNGQDPGRGCVPEKGSSANSVFRANNYATGAVNPTNGNNVVVTYGSYINRDSQEASGCAPAGFSSSGTNLYNGVKNGGCNNDIVLSASTNGGRTFSGTRTDPRIMPVVTTGPNQQTTDQFWQGESYTPQGKLAVGYYDRSYGNDESTGYSDFSVSGSPDAVTFTSQRATSSSMPPPTQFSGLFYGDYSDTATAGPTAYPVWSDTRQTDLFLCPGTGTPGHPPLTCAASAPNAPLANDQVISTAAVQP
ncbi:MAG: exo-alpha-sialidase, partial [Acidimicrobiales bacterium]